MSRSHRTPAFQSKPQDPIVLCFASTHIRATCQFSVISGIMSFDIQHLLPIYSQRHAANNSGQ
jgi:hypothetical protein